MKYDINFSSSINTYIHKFIDNEFILCGVNSYINTPIVLHSANDFYKIKYKLPGQEILYIHDRKWSIEESILYLYTLIELPIELLSDTRLFKSYYYRINYTDFNNDKQCECTINRNIVCLSNEYDINICHSKKYLDNKCTFCPISFNCPICTCIDKDNICYMHQAESIAILIKSQTNINPIWINLINIPYSWTILFGNDIQHMVYNIIDSLYFNIYKYSNLVFNKKVTFELSKDIHRIINCLPTYHDIDESSNTVSCILDDNSIRYLSKKYNIIDIIYNHNECNKDIVYVNNISIGTNTSCDIVYNNIGLGNPNNYFTYSILLVMYKYIGQSDIVLDVGCGCGTTSMYATKCGARYVDAIDIDSSCINSTIQSIHINGISNIDVFKIDVFKYIQNPNKLYDIIIGNLEFPIQSKLVTNIYKLLNIGGIYIAGGIHRLVEQYIIKLIPPELEIIDTQYFFSAVILILRRVK